MGTARILSAFEARSNVGATPEGSVSDTGVDERLVVYEIVATSDGENEPVSAQLAARHEFATLAGSRNFGSALESATTVEDGMAVPLVPNDWSAAVGYVKPLAFVTARFAERTEIVPEQVEPTAAGVTRKNRIRVSLPRTRLLPGSA
jgi:hypothetical protein